MIVSDVVFCLYGVQYKYVKPLGKGSYGRVDLVHSNKEYTKEYAVKTMSRCLGRNVELEVHRATHGDPNFVPYITHG